LTKLWPQPKEGEKLKKQTTKFYKGQFSTPKKFLVCCFAPIKIQKIQLLNQDFVELQSQNDPWCFVLDYVN
jgi:hypothetical protein